MKNISVCIANCYMYNSVSHQKYSQFFETNIKNWRQFWEEHWHIISYLNLLSFSNYEKKISDKWIFSEIFFIAICILYKLKEMYIVVNCQKNILNKHSICDWKSVGRFTRVCFETKLHSRQWAVLLQLYYIALS